jgi:glycosyltransferase involved in cell wall biosynthesis
MPNFVLEAMAHGTPVVATAVGGVPDVVTDGVTGWLVPAEDSRALADALAHALGDPDEAAGRARAARKRVEEEFSPEATANNWMRLYDDVIGARQ